MIKTKALAKTNDKHQQAELEFAKMIENVGVRGFHGTASVTVNVQDGHIQYTRVIVDRMVR